MKKNILQNVTEFILKYIWMFCMLLVALELISVAYTSTILMQQSAQGVMQSVSGEISGRVDGVLRLLTGLSADERFSDSSKSLFDRVTHALPYQESYNLFMIAMTDKDINVVSADEKEPPTEFYNLGYRDYMQRLYATGEYQITDAILSGDGTNTKNYTIAVPIMKDGAVDGTVFGSIYFKDIEDTVNRNSRDSGRKFYLFGADNTVMAGDNDKIYGKSFMELSGGNYFFGSDARTIDSSMLANGSGSYWEWDGVGLTYATYRQVAPTNWIILYRVQFGTVFANLAPVLAIKICFYILLCAALYLIGRRYLNRHFAQINHLLNRMAAIQKRLFQSEQPDYDDLLELTEQGLTDQLTGLSTRGVLLQKMAQQISEPNARGAVMFIDLDDLKSVNDSYGHDGGDYALVAFAQVLRDYEQRYNAVASRYGGDEFILVFNAENRKKIVEIAENLCGELNITVTMKEHTLAIHGSIGVSFYPEDGTEPEELICKADLALYTAKQEGKNRCAFFDEEK